MATNPGADAMRKALFALATLCAAIAPAGAQDDPATFYKGKVVRLVVGVGVGSGYDINARLLARYLPKYIPGNPSVIVQNQPGAGSLTMTNQLYAGGPFDGTVIGASFNGLPTTPLLQPAGARFEATKINWVGSTNRETQASYVWHTAPVKTFDDVMKTETIIGAQAPGSTQYDYPVLANALFGTKFKVITGYQATPKIHLAMERGEVHGTWANWSTLKAIASNWIEEKKITILAQWALRKHPELPNVPLILDWAKTDADKQALQLALGRLEFGRPFFLPPNVPADRVNAIRRAFDAATKDKDFLAEAEKLKIEIDPLTGEQVAALIVDIYKTPTATVERVRAAMAPK
jgi:tripartite-type tricarboxylate transporter receptor subunit TctC